MFLDDAYTAQDVSHQRVHQAKSRPALTLLLHVLGGNSPPSKPIPASSQGACNLLLRVIFAMRKRVTTLLLCLDPPKVRAAIGSEAQQPKTAKRGENRHRPRFQLRGGRPCGSRAGAPWRDRPLQGNHADHGDERGLLHRALRHLTTPRLDSGLRGRWGMPKRNGAYIPVEKSIRMKGSREGALPFREESYGRHGSPQGAQATKQRHMAIPSLAQSGDGAAAAPGRHGVRRRARQPEPATDIATNSDTGTGIAGGGAGAMAAAGRWRAPMRVA
jgi:hypothetical protein